MKLSFLTLTVVNTATDMEDPAQSSATSFVATTMNTVSEVHLEQADNSTDDTQYNNQIVASDSNDRLNTSAADLFSFLERASDLLPQQQAKLETPGTSGDASFVDQGNGMMEVDNSDVENLGMAALKPSRPSSAGPLRHRRGHQDRQLSINSFASNVSTSDNTGNKHDQDSADGSEAQTATSSEQRTVKLGDHAFVIPLTSPIVPPQLQAHMRVTSTGRPSHARKVPDDHVKVSSCFLGVR